MSKKPNLYRRVIINSKKAETRTLCGRAEQHEFCDNCGMLLCEGELCGGPLNAEVDEKDEKDDSD